MLSMMWRLRAEGDRIEELIQREVARGREAHTLRSTAEIDAFFNWIQENHPWPCQQP
jgi:hypothetical protein